MTTLINIKLERASCHLHLPSPPSPPPSPADLLPRSAGTFSFSKKNLERSKEMIEVYPKLIIFCPKEKDELDGNKCVKCPYFSGLDIKANERIFIKCDFKSVGRGKNEK